MLPRINAIVLITAEDLLAWLSGQRDRLGGVKLKGSNDIVALTYLKNLQANQPEIIKKAFSRSLEKSHFNARSVGLLNCFVENKITGIDQLDKLLGKKLAQEANDFVELYRSINQKLPQLLATSESKETPESQKKDQSLLEEFLDIVLRSNLAPKVIADTAKIVICFIYIHNHLDEIAKKVDQKDDRSIYSNDRDYKNRVLRDDEGTSFHIHPYKNGQEAVQVLQAYIEQITYLLKNLSQEDKLKFAEKFQYDENVGCLEARIARAQTWAQRRLKILPVSIDDILAEATQLRGKAPTLLAAAIQYCRTEEIEIDPDTLEQRIKELCLEEAEKASPSINVTHAVHTKQDYTGMIQYHFPTEEDAESFLQQVKQHAKKPKGVDKATVKHESCTHGLKTLCYIVRLTQEQIDTLAISTPKAVELLEEKNHHPPVVTALPDRVTTVSRGFLFIQFSLQLHFATEETAAAFLQGDARLSSKKITSCACQPARDARSCCAVELDSETIKDIGGKYAYDLLFMPHQTIGPQRLSEIIKGPRSLVLELIALSQDYEGQCTLQKVAQHLSPKAALWYQSPEAFMAYLAKLNPETCRKAALLTSKEGGCTLQTMASYQSSEAFIAYLAKLDPETCRKAALLTSKEGWCTLKAGARYQSSEAFMAYLAKLDPETCRKAALLTSKEGGCTLQPVAQYQSSEAFMAYLAKLDPETCRKAALLKGENGWCTLQTGARYQSPEAFMAYLAKLDPDTCRQAALLTSKDGQYTLRSAAEYQSPQAFKCLLTDFNNEKGMQQINSDLKVHSDKIFFSLLQYIALYQTSDNVAGFLNLLDKTAWSRLEKLFMIEDNYSTRLLLRTLLAKAEVVIVSNTHLKQLLDIYDQQHPTTGTPDTSSISELFRQGKAAIKIIRDITPGRPRNDWYDFCRQLADYNYRPNCRTEKNHDRAWKFVHLPTSVPEDKASQFISGAIVRYRNKEEQRQHKKTKKLMDFSHTKKTPATYISQYLHTGLFGYHDSTRTMVGLVFNLDLCKVKAMLSRDSGTYWREWVGTDLNNLVSYANEIQTISYQDIGLFKKQVDQQPYVVNEALIKVTLESVVAIVIGRDTKEARQLAAERQADFQRRFGRQLPIVIYDPERKNIYAYSNEKCGPQLLR